MLTRFSECQGRTPESVGADTTYGNGEFLQWLADRGITPHMRTRDSIHRKRSLFFGPERFTNEPKDGTIMMPAGHVRVEQLAAVLSTLPLDLTFVDAEDRVAFFSEGPDRIFARSKAIIGRKVQHCHPPRSADTVNKILDDFRAGRQNVAEFWINFQNEFVHIRYFAVRNDEGKYLGTVELTQDLAPLRQLSGERRLLANESNGSH